MKFLSPEVALYLCKSIILPCMEYCCHILGHCLNVSSLSLFIGITLVDVHLNWFNWSTSLFSREVYLLF